MNCNPPADGINDGITLVPEIKQELCEYTPDGNGNYCDDFSI